MRQRSRPHLLPALTLCLVATSFLTATPARPAERSNRPPTLTPLADQPLRAGARDRLELAAADPDGDPLEFRLVKGPSFASVKTLDARDGRGEIALSPDSCLAGGTEVCVIEVSDGTASDTDTMRLFIKAVDVALPSTPMLAPLGPPPRRVGYDPSTVDSAWLLGAWEWQGTQGTRYAGFRIRGSRKGPIDKGYRRRFVLRPGGKLELFEIGPDRVLREVRGSYQATHGVGGTKLTFSDWFDPWAKSYSVGRGGSTSLSLYPWHWADANTDFFVRAGAAGADIDARRLITPFDTATVTRRHVSIPGPMEAALRKHDPRFQIEERSDRPSAIVGDFDGDLLRDVALLGRSGADQVVVAILSASGNIRVVEVAWRKVLPGGPGRESRSDPAPLPPVYLELAPRGSLNPFCWSRREAAPLDAIGIVDATGVRFDYVLGEDQFTLFAPVR